MQPVHVTAPRSLFGIIANLRIEAGSANSLAGVLTTAVDETCSERAFA
jgi:hypothetical protein